MIGYLLNALTVTTVLLIVANVLNINLFPFVSQAVRATSRSWKEGRSLEGLATAVDAALDIFNVIDGGDSGASEEHVWNMEKEGEN